MAPLTPLPFPESARRYLQAWEAHRRAPSPENRLRREVALEDLLLHPSWTPERVRRQREVLRQRRLDGEVAALARMAQRAQGGSV